MKFLWEEQVLLNNLLITIILQLNVFPLQFNYSYLNVSLSCIQNDIIADVSGRDILYMSMLIKA